MLRKGPTTKRNINLTFLRTKSRKLWVIQACRNHEAEAEKARGGRPKGGKTIKELVRQVLVKLIISPFKSIFLELSITIILKLFTHEPKTSRNSPDLLAIILC